MFPAVEKSVTLHPPLHPASCTFAPFTRAPHPVFCTVMRVHPYPPKNFHTS